MSADYDDLTAEDAPYGNCPNCGAPLENWDAASHGNGGWLACPNCEEIVDEKHVSYCQCVDCQPWMQDADYMDDAPRCSICNCVLEWEDCGSCEDGYVDLYEDDPLWYDPGDVELCNICGGNGGWLACPNAEHHDKETKTNQPAP